ncbi:hypothetical protein BH18ACT4_BH18ACT4_05590 [soil metagenome]
MTAVEPLGPDRRGEGKPTTSIFEDHLPVSRLVVRYAVTGLVTLMIVAVATTYASRRQGTLEAIEDANRVASLAAGAEVEPVLDDGILTRTPSSIAVVDEVVRNEVLGGSLVRVKIWSGDGTILYSDESRLIGDRFELDEEELEILRGGDARAAVSDLSEPENRHEESATEMLEVYLPMRTPSGVPLLFEAYFRYEGVAEAGRQVWLRFAPITLGALVLLELLQIPLAVSLARRLRRTQQQREALLRSAIDATDAERRRIASDLHDGVVQGPRTGRPGPRQQADRPAIGDRRADGQGPPDEHLPAPGGHRPGAGGAVGPGERLGVGAPWAAPVARERWRPVPGVAPEGDDDAGQIASRLRLPSKLASRS